MIIMSFRAADGRGVAERRSWFADRYPMRHLTLLLLTAVGSTPLLAQQPSRVRCRDCTPEARAAEMRAVQVRDSLRALGGFELALEQLARELAVKGEVEAQLVRVLRQLDERREHAANRQQVEVLGRQLREQLADATRDRQTLRARLASLCDRSAKPDGYMGITFSANMRADTLRGGSEVFRFAEYPTVETVEPGSPAERAGVETGDEIVRINGRSIVGQDIVFSRILRPGMRLPVRVRRDGDVRDVTIVVAERPAGIDNGCPWLDARLALAFGDAPVAIALPRAPEAPSRRAATGPAVAPAAPGRRVTVTRTPNATAIVTTDSGPARVTIVGTPKPLMPSAVAGTVPGATTFMFSSSSSATVAGATIVRMNPDLRESFGVERGVLVLDVARGSPAARSGLKGGDVILTAGGTPVTTPLGVLRGVETARGRALELRIVRKRQQQEVVLRW